MLSRGFTKHQINKILQNYIIDELKRHIKPAKVLRSDIYIIIGSCFPASNFFLKYKLSNVYFPAKLEKFINDNPNITMPSEDADALSYYANAIYGATENTISFGDPTGENTLYLIDSRPYYWIVW